MRLVCVSFFILLLGAKTSPQSFDEQTHSRPLNSIIIMSAISSIQFYSQRIARIFQASKQDIQVRLKDNITTMTRMNKLGCVGTNKFNTLFEVRAGPARALIVVNQTKRKAVIVHIQAQHNNDWESSIKYWSKNQFLPE